MVNTERKKKNRPRKRRQAVVQNSELLLKLNDDCIEYVLNKLRFRDLCAASKTCTKFRDIAGIVYQRDFSKKVKLFFFIFARHEKQFAHENSIFPIGIQYVNHGVTEQW